jgi:hypothetical protein
MGLRFRKSIKIAPGVKVNIGKKSVGMSFGGKYGGISMNSKTGTRARVTAYGTGLSYTTSLNGKRSSKRNTAASNPKQKAAIAKNRQIQKYKKYESNVKKHKLTEVKVRKYRTLFLIFSIAFIITGYLFASFSNLIGGIFIMLGFIYVYLTYSYSDILKIYFKNQ